MHFRKLNWVLISIVILTLVLRLWRIDSLATFGGDQGYDLEKVKGILAGNFTLLGPRIGPYNNISVLYLGPFYYYLLAPFLLITKLDPLGAALATVFARVLTVILIYLVAEKLFGKKAAFYPAVISAVSPYWFNYLGPSSNPYFIPPIVLSVMFILLSVKKKYAISIFTAGFLSGLAFQLHYLSLILIPIIFIFIFFKSKKWINYIIVLLGLLLGILPQLLFEIRHEFFTTHQLLKLFNSQIISTSAKEIILRMNDFDGFASRDLLGFGLPLFIISSLILILVFTAKGKFQKQNNPIILLLFSLILINFVAAIFYFGQAQPHYLALAYPAYFIFVGQFIYMTGKINKYIPHALLIIIAIFLIRQNNFSLSSGYTMPQDLTLPKIREISKIIAASSGTETFNIASTLDGDSRALPYRYLTQVYGKNPESVENYDKPDSLYIITRDPARSVRENKLFEIASFQPSTVKDDWAITGDIHLIKLTKSIVATKQVEKFVTIVNPVRSRSFWVSPQISLLKNQIDQIGSLHLPATWLLAYDNLFDDEVINLFKHQDNTQEIGAFLEVSQKWATDAKVSYKVADGDYYRPDKVFLSGYPPRDREKLIEKYFEVFRQKFGYFPNSVGAWYIDSYSQKLLSKFGVTAVLTVADQFDTDAAMVWGKYFSYPYYPSKYNSLEPANDQSNKIPIVNLQWAQRDPVAGYGKEILASRQSFQANDYLNNGFGHSYFKDLLATYLGNKKTDFEQITIGLEAGQEAARFSGEFSSQLDEISNLSKSGQINIVKMSDFAAWYYSKYPGISPSHFLEKGSSFWYMSPKFRVAVFAENNHYYLKDLRYYSNGGQRDYFYKDTNNHLQKEVPASIDNLVMRNEIDLGQLQDISIEEKFDRLKITLGAEVFEINTSGVSSNGKYLLLAPKVVDNQSKLVMVKMANSLLDKFKLILNLFKYSKIDNNHVVGFAPGGNKLIGLEGLKPGIYTFDFQTLSKFKSPAQTLDKWQPWIN